jgi:hypothetical protein
MRAAPSTMQISDRFRNDSDRSALAAGTARELDHDTIRPAHKSEPDSGVAGQRTDCDLGAFRTRSATAASTSPTVNPICSSP